MVPLNFRRWYDFLGDEILYFLSYTGEIFRCHANQFFLVSSKSELGQELLTVPNGAVLSFQDRIQAEKRQAIAKYRKSLLRIYETMSEEAKQVDEV